MKLLNAAGHEFDAELFVVPRDGTEGFAIIFQSRGGKKGSPSARNPDYFPALEELLRRFKEAQAVIATIYVDSERVRHLSIQERVLEMDFPLRVHDLENLNELRREICRKQQPVGRRPGTSGGNSTKQIRLEVEPCSDMPNPEAAKKCLRPLMAEEPEFVPRPPPTLPDEYSPKEGFRVKPSEPLEEEPGYVVVKKLSLLQRLLLWICQWLPPSRKR